MTGGLGAHSASRFAFPRGASCYERQPHVPLLIADDHPRTSRSGLRGRSGMGASRGWRTVALLMLCVVFAGLLSSCGQENPKGEGGAAPLGERAENDVPLNPPTLRFHVSSDGQVDASPDLEAEAGEAVALVLENESATRYELRLLNPEGGQVFAVEAPAGGRGDGRAMPRDVGAHVAEIRPVDGSAAAEQFTVDVSET